MITEGKGKRSRNKLKSIKMGVKQSSISVRIKMRLSRCSRKN